MTALNALVAPREYFRDSEGTLSSGALVFVGYFIASLVVFVLTLEWLMARLEGAPVGLRGEVYSQLVGVVVLTLVVFVIGWLVVGAIMHLIGGVGTDGHFAAAMAVAGWAYAPELLTMPLSAGLVWFDIRDLTIDASSPAAVQAEIEAMQSPSVFDPSFLLLVVVTAWSVFILARGIQGSHDAEPGSAWAAAILVGVGSMLLALAGVTIA